MVESPSEDKCSSRSSWADCNTFNPRDNTSWNSFDTPCGWWSSRCLGPQQPPTPIFGFSKPAKARTSERSFECDRNRPPLFGSCSIQHPPKFFGAPDTAKAGSSSDNPFSIEIIVKEIINEFKHMQGEPIYTFGREPTPGLEAIRDAIHQNTKELIDKINTMKAATEARRLEQEAVQKKIELTVTYSRARDLEYRVTALENLWCEFASVYIK